MNLTERCNEEGTWIELTQGGFQLWALVLCILEPRILLFMCHAAWYSGAQIWDSFCFCLFWVLFDLFHLFCFSALSFPSFEESQTKGNVKDIHNTVKYCHF